MKLTNVYFDLDGTIIDSSECAVFSTQLAFRSLISVEVSEESIRHNMGLPIEKSFPMFANLPEDDAAVSRLIEEFRMIYRKNSERLTAIIPEIAVVLERLSQTTEMAIVTSKKTDVALRNLKTFNIDHFFTCVIGSDKAHGYKPSAAPLKEARRVLNNQNCNEFMIGDATFDIEMAINAGVRPVGVTWGSHSRRDLDQAGAEFVLDTPAELLGILA